MNYRVIDRDTYYRKGVFRHFSEDCKCSISMTARVDVTELVRRSKEAGTKFYIDFLYILSKVLNSREDYRMGYLWETDELICYDVINPTQYVFHEDTETCSPVYTTTTRTTTASTPAPSGTSRRRKRPVNTGWTWRSIRTGSTRRSYPGCPTTR
jgi:chloramphenicol O-acetyltransferase